MNPGGHGKRVTFKSSGSYKEKFLCYRSIIMVDRYVNHEVITSVRKFGFSTFFSDSFVLLYVTLPHTYSWIILCNSD